MWLAENEGAKFWLNVLTELKNRGLQDILIACVDGLKGFPDAINSVYPQISSYASFHMVRNSLKYVSWKDYKGVTSGLKAVYQAPTEEAALMALDKFAGAGTKNIRKSAKAGVRTGKTSIPSSLSTGYPQGHLHDECHRITE
jgi:putative transposase